MKPSARAGLMVLLFLLVPAWSVNAQPRSTILLDGTWQIAEGDLDTPPAHFARQIPVPGLVDLANPSFADVGTTGSGKHRKAFWYRREFTIDQPIPPVVRLKIHKAMYGTKVWVNGKAASEHLPCFTPAEFDIRPFLNEAHQSNTLLIRVGADRGILPKTIPDGTDFEKFDYAPGIYDSVELILTGSPRVANVQVAPDLPNRAARVVVWIEGSTLQTKVVCNIRESVSGKPIGRAEASGQTDNGTVELRVSMPGFHPWSPESPFLYTAEVSTEGDTFTTRFGMRSFRLDAQSGRAILNGKPYFLRGTNVCILRFFEDPLRAKLPWTEQWVRRLHRVFKEQMHWNSARYCIGFPPEMWYRIADEEGILIQDEFPLWYGGKWPADLKADELVREYGEWMRERWNHPSVVLWDACNETISTEAGKAIHQVRGLDLASRPWDNGWSPPDALGDCYEAHPYVFASRTFRLHDLATLSGAPGVKGCITGNPAPNTLGNPIIINEYSWGHLDRLGQPTHPWMVNFYEDFLGTNSTIEQRFEFHGRVMAAETEFWRARRKVAGLLHFCGLTYSKPKAVTSDHFSDIEKLTLEPKFLKYVGDSFAPTGIMVDYWEDTARTGSKIDVPVIVTNDLDSEWAGKVRLHVSQSSTVVSDESQHCRVAALAQATLRFTVSLPAKSGMCQIVAELLNAENAGPRSLRDVEVLSDSELQQRRGLAFGRPVKASSSVTVSGQTYPAEAAVDGNGLTRWSSEFSDPQWIAIDLGTPATISRVELAWEAAYGLAYSIEVSDDGVQFKSVYSTEAGKGGVEKISFPPTKVRWVRMHGTKRGSPTGGYSLYEFRVYPCSGKE